MNEPITRRQQEILDFLRWHVVPTCPLSIREIGEAVGLSSSSTVQNHLNTLERKGYITRTPLQSRSIRLAEPAEETVPA